MHKKRAKTKPKAGEERSGPYLTEKQMSSTRKRKGPFPWSPSLLRKWRMRGQGPPYLRVNKSIYYHVSSVQRWLLAHEVEGK